MNRIQKAVSCFKKGFSCSQAVLSTYSQSLGLDRDTALKISQSFGGGMAHLGEACGAVTGAFMVIGLKHGRIKAEDIQAKDKTYEIVSEFVKRFKDTHRSISCTELLGCDLNTPEGLKTAEETALADTLCPQFVQSAAEILEKIL